MPWPVILPPMENAPSGEPSKEVSKHWTLWREDIYGNQYKMPIEFDSKSEALSAQETYTAKGHHQTYFTKEMSADDDTDFISAKSA
jgi:hypothetical protein